MWSLNHGSTTHNDVRANLGFYFIFEKQIFAWEKVE